MKQDLHPYFGFFLMYLGVTLLVLFSLGMGISYAGSCASTSTLAVSLPDRPATACTDGWSEVRPSRALFPRTMIWDGVRPGWEMRRKAMMVSRQAAT